MVARTFFAFNNENLVDNTTGVGVINNSSTPDGTQFTYNNGGGAVVTIDDTGGSADIFEDDLSGSHTITDGGGLVANGTGVESESIIRIREVDASGNLIGPEITITVFSQNGNVSDVWGFVTTVELTNGATYEKISGSNVGTAAYSNLITCFAAGTLIDTANGKMRVEDIEVGQLVWTRDAGLQPVRWASSTTVAGRGNYAPVVFAPGAFGNCEELVVSQQHRMLVSGPTAELYFDTNEALVAAKHLVGLDGVTLRDCDEVEYCHFMFDQHQIVRANGHLTESFFLTNSSVNALEVETRNELVSLFPTLEQGFDAFGDTALMTLSAHEAAVWCRAQSQAA